MLQDESIRYEGKFGKHTRCSGTIRDSQAVSDSLPTSAGYELFAKLKHIIGHYRRETRVFHSGLSLLVSTTGYAARLTSRTWLLTSIAIEPWADEFSQVPLGRVVCTNIE